MRKNAIALVCTAVLVALIFVPAALSSRPNPQSVVQEEIAAATDLPGGESASAQNGPGAATPEAAVESGETAPTPDGKDESAREVIELDDGRECVSNAVIVGIADGVSIDEVNARIAELSYVATPSITEDDVCFGYVKLDLASGVEVQDAIGRLEFEDFTSAAQPDYVYHALEGYEEADGADDASGASPAFQAATSADLAAQTTSVNDEYSKLDAADANTHWMLTAINAYEAWDHVNGRANHKVTVAVVDSGVKTSHDDLKNNLVNGYNAITEKETADEGMAAVEDDNGHGTHVAGIVAAQANNTIGVAGVSYNAYIMPVKVIDTNGSLDTSDAIAGLKWVYNHRSDNPSAPVCVVNMSFGGPYDRNVTASDSDPNDVDACFLAAINELQAEDEILVVCAAGNYADRVGHVRGGATTTESPYRCFPCDYDAEAIGVINLTHSGSSYYRVTGSNYNVGNARTKELSAPGTSIFSTMGGSYGEMSGTSMAAPCVSGVAAMLFAANPSLKASEVKSYLTNNADGSIGTSAGWDQQTGYGLVDAAAALKAAAPNGAPLLSGGNKVQKGKAIQLSVSNSSSSWSWSSSDTSVATVNGGEVTGVKAGSAVITATSDDITLSQTVNVYDPTIIGDSVLLGTATQLLVSNANPSDAVWKWTTSDESIVRILNATNGSIYGQKLGEATVTVSLVADSSISYSETVTVTSTNIANATVTGVEDQVYTGESITLSDLVVRMYSTAGSTTGYTTLRKGVDYEVAYENNTEIGTATVTITGKGGYAGTYTDTFRIGRYGLSDAKVEGTASYTYTGSAIEVADLEVTTSSGTKLVKGQDYETTYENNVNAGTATVRIDGINDFVGSVPAYFTINALPITSSAITVSGITEKTYTGAEITQSPVLTYNGMTLVEGTDYDVYYSNNTNAGTATMSFRGRGNYETFIVLFFPAYRQETFTINPAPISSASFSFGSTTYNGSPQKLSPTTATLGGKSLTLGTDYTITYPDDCTNAGTKTVTINGQRNYTGTKSASYTINKKAATISANSKSKVYDGTALTGAQAGYTPDGFVNSTDIASVTLSGSVTNVGKATSAVSKYTLTSAASPNYTVTTKSGTLEVTAASIATATVTLDSASCTYDGTAKTPGVTVRMGSTLLRRDIDYTLSYANNTNIGTASVTVTGKGNYTGTTTKTFAIAAKRQSMYRLYNPNSGEHFYTASADERSNLVRLGWHYEGIAWTAPSLSDTPVYRLYNPNAGDHHYTTSKEERNHLRSVGWRYEGIGWYSDDAKGQVLYRLYNPNAVAGAHHYTTSKTENDYLVKVGWRAEGYAWYGLK